MKNRRPYRALLAVGLLASAFLSGCATASKPAAMTPPSITVERKHPHTVNLTVQGGSDTSALGASKIANGDYETALRTAIEQSGVFARVVGNDSRYQLDVVIARLEQPIMGASMKVTIETNWTLRKRGEAAPIWQKAIVSTYTAKFGDALAGVTRLRLANEGAARQNIEDGIKQISALTLN